jgi:hypothetical protein
MHANDPHSDDNLSQLERRLAGWQPAAAGLDADALLFAAGRASACPPRRRFVWPALACTLTLLSLGLGSWLAVERGERLTLAQELAQRKPVETPQVAPVQPMGNDEPSPASYLVVRDLVTRKGVNALPELAPPRVDGASSPVFDNQSILQVWMRDRLTQ